MIKEVQVACWQFTYNVQIRQKIALTTARQYICPHKHIVTVGFMLRRLFGSVFNLLCFVVSLSEQGSAGCRSRNKISIPSASRNLVDNEAINEELVQASYIVAHISIIN